MDLTKELLWTEAMLNECERIGVRNGDLERRLDQLLGLVGKSQSVESLYKQA